jgi:hypothetical protein
VLLVALVVQVVQVVQVDLVLGEWVVQVEAVGLAVQVDMDRVENMMEDLSQSDRIHPQKEDILFVVGEDHSSSLLTPTILI